MNKKLQEDILVLQNLLHRIFVKPVFLIKVLF